LSLGIHCSYRNKRGATTEKKKKKTKKMAIQKNLEQHSCLFPYLQALPPPFSSFLFSGNRAIGNSSILRQANEDFQKQLQQQLQEKDSSILRFHPKMRREREREREKEQLLSNFSESLLSSSSHLLRTSSLGSKLAFTFVCLSVGCCCCCNCRSSKIRFVCFVLVCLAQSSVFF
jgi:hypothetical protein